MSAIKIKESVIWSGYLKITITTPARKKTFYLNNLITDVGLNLLRDTLREGKNAEIKYVALGTSNTLPANGDTKLGNEIFRKITTKDEAPAIGQTKTIYYIAPYEANEAIEELGFFAGPEATETKDSGIMIARVLFSRTKNELESWSIERTDTLGR